MTFSQILYFFLQFSNNFRVRSQSIDKGSFNANLAFALQTQEGTAEEVFISVANFYVFFCLMIVVITLDCEPHFQSLDSQWKFFCEVRIFLHLPGFFI